MNNIFHILVKEKTGLDRHAADIQFGVPFPESLFFNHKELAVITDDGSVLASNISVTALWPDNSIKWCSVKAQVKLLSNQSLRLRVDKHSDKFDPVHCTSGFVFETDDKIKIKTKRCLFTLSKKSFNFIQKVTRNNISTSEHGYCILMTKQYGQLKPEISSYHYHTSSSFDCPLSSELTIRGDFLSTDGDLIANFESHISFFIKTDMVKCSLTLHNPKPALHTSGLWDLGDPNSLIFSSFDLGMTINDITDINWKIENNQPWKSLEQQPLCIYQESSGGINWDSPNHKNSNNKVPYSLNGFECKSQNSILQTGKRASPTIRLNTQAGHIGLFIERFWQNCPKSISINNNQINIGLFPEQFNDDFELQPGEKKTHQFYLDFGEDFNALAQFTSPMEVSLNPEWIERCKVFPNFQLSDEDDLLQMIISQGLTGPDNFFNKREKIDEYGWRNFGDIFADHETYGYQDEELFISHYNNQYDPIYGFLRQYALTGNNQWFELADDLARHVVDIDIYHTEYDKEEYNGGLFWHTDHYLPAETSSHRSYSKYQKTNAYEDHAGGGGPGGQHCYTTGLLYHYLLTGNINSKNAVIKLTNWIRCYYEGSGTFLNFLIFLKNSSRHDLKNIKTGHYPLDRGTGNYINALLDNFVLTQQRSNLGRVENIIKNTVHPLDNISQRQLENVETTWFYTVFFQSLCRYLSTKEELSEFDEPFYYARDSLLHYADWMVENEYPYLQKPDILEFPNHTWTAQDIRKVNILLLSAYYAPEWESHYAKKAQDIYSYIVKNLSHDKTRTYTRILAILMQNQGVANFSSHITAKNSFLKVSDYKPTQEYGFNLAFKHILKELFKVIMQFSLRKEIQWACRRSTKLARLLGYRP